MARSIPMGVRTAKSSIVLAVSLATLSFPALAGWQDQGSPADLDRLGHLAQIRDAALADAGHGQGRGDGRAIARVMQPEGHAIHANDLIGHWRCRQFKLGGMTPYMVYDRWFDCNIRASD